MPAPEKDCHVVVPVPLSGGPSQNTSIVKVEFTIETQISMSDRDFWFPSSVVPANEVDVAIQEENIARHRPVRAPSLAHLFRVDAEFSCIVIQSLSFWSIVRNWRLNPDRLLG
ncbi:hypothetical protein AZE42_03424 [Rhizopogon vesiculosus]|uniref:Uncharacterized protein n=1 Tax=Rhizopogon vesiculosus TaxID=180088 RepID=A0A1J8PEY2_9AGAM|nr:hypothetical protein AZE42_03424 [Rhizopogon vesiculosus]